MYKDFHFSIIYNSEKIGNNLNDQQLGDKSFIVCLLDVILYLNYFYNEFYY